MNPPSGFLFFGDRFARQERDAIGLPLRLAAALGAPVRDLTTPGGIREIYERISSMPDLPHHDRVNQHTPQPIILLGAEDAKGGGCSPAAYIGAVKAIRLTCADLGWRPPLILFAPSCPPTTNVGLRGFAKGSRRWLERMAGFLNADAAQLSQQPVIVPPVRSDHFLNQLTLKTEGIDELAAWIAARLRPS